MKEYREWLYENIPAEKIAAIKRNYFSPAEIDFNALKEKPDLIDYWIKNVPRDLQKIQSSIKYHIPEKNLAADSQR